MRRREVLLGSAAAAAVSLPALNAYAQDAHSQIAELLQAMHASEAAGDHQRTRSLGLQLSPLSLQDANWYTYPESFEVAALLLRVLDPRDVEAYGFAAVAVIRSWASCTNVGPLSAQQSIGSAAYGLLIADKSDPTHRYARDCELAGPLLLAAAGATSGPQRQTWAREALEAVVRYPSQTMAVFRNDPVTARFFACAMAMSGDWAGAAAEYERLLASDIGQITVNPHEGLPYQGLRDIVSGDPPLKTEAASVFALTGQQDRAVKMLEDLRREVVSVARVDPVLRALDGATLEERLARRNVIVVQPAVSFLGSMTIASALVNGKVARRVAFDPNPGGLQLFTMMTRSGVMPDDKPDGIVPLYANLRRYDDAGQPARLQKFIDLLSTAATYLMGQTLPVAISRLGAGQTADIAVVVPPELALLPLSLTADRSGDALIAGRSVSYADSLVSAVSTAERSQGQATATRSIAILSGASDLQYQAFETACVSSHFRGSNDALTTSAQLAGLDGPSYWHVASHAASDYRDPTRSGIRISRTEVATFTEIERLRPRTPPRLVFLSACETALIDVSKGIRDYAGLTSAFLSIGATGVIGSLWPVSDAATSLLATRFYDEHLDRGLAPAAALRASQLWLRNATAQDLRTYVAQQVAAGHCEADEGTPFQDLLSPNGSDSPPFAHPYFWGGFQLYGA